MRQAPAASVHSAGGWLWPAFQTLLFTVAAASLAAWASFHAGLPPVLRMGCMVTATLAAALSVGWFVRQPRVEVAWDGAEWRVDGEPSSLNTMFDFDRWVLVRARRLSGISAERRLLRAHPRWLFVDAADAGPAFRAWRTALCAERSH